MTQFDRILLCFFVKGYRFFFFKFNFLRNPLNTSSFYLPFPSDVYNPELLQATYLAA